jgi:hypothetical protein
MNHPELDPYLAGLRPRPCGWVVACVLLACGCASWLGWCLVCIAQAHAVSRAVEACSAAGQTWTGSSCVAQEINIHLEPHAAPSAGNPLNGPGGA